MQQTLKDSDKAFIEACIRQGSADYVVPITRALGVANDLLKTFVKGGMPGSRVVETADRSLCCICTKCGYTIDGAGVGTLLTVFMEGAENITFTGRSEKAQRFLGGHCVNAKCSSQEVRLRWHDDYKLAADQIAKECPIRFKDDNKEPSPTGNEETPAPLKPKKRWWCFWRRK